MGERLPLDNRAKGGSLLVLPTTATMPRDLLTVSSSIRPALGATARTVGGADYATPSDATMIVSDPTGLVTIVATSV